MESLINDLRFALRTLRKSPGFAVAAIVTLGLGIGATALVFSLVNAIMLRPFPFHQPDRLIVVSEDDRERGVEGASVAYPTFAEWKAQNRSFEGLGAFQSHTLTLRAGNTPERHYGASVSHDMFNVLGVEPVLGRGFRADEDVPGAPAVALIGHSLWQRTLASDPGVIGRNVVIDGASHTIVGVMAPDFKFPEWAEVWVPFALRTPPDPGNHFLRVMGRIRPDVTLRQARADLESISTRLAVQYPQNAHWVPRLQPLREFAAQDMRTMLLMQLGAVGFVLLIACANVANLLLARAAGREKEMSIRAALGASRSRMLRQLLTESLVLAVAGGALGILLAGWWIDLVIGLIPVALPFWLRFEIDRTVLAFTVGLATVTALVFGLAPALQALRADVFTGLRAGRGLTPGSRRSRMRSALIIGQVALTVVLLAGGLLLVRSFLAMKRVDPGFETRSVVAMHLDVPESRYDDPRTIAFYRELVTRTRALPGVEAVGLTSSFPISDDARVSNFSIAGHRTENGDGHATHLAITPEYFHAMKVQILRGRPFSDADDEQSAPVAIVNNTLAERFFADEDPIGRRIRFGAPTGEGAWYTIVGIVADMNQSDMNQLTIAPDLYRPFAQEPHRAMALAVRASGPVSLLANGVRETVRTIDPDVPVFDVKTVRQVLDESVWDSRLYGILFIAFSLTALLLASVGLYGVVNYSVSQRSHEIGVRVALGARPDAVLRLIVREGLSLALVGVAIGLVGAFGVGRLLAGALFGVRPADPLTLIAVPLLLTAVAAVASFIPARRAARVNPLVVLRSD